MVERHSFEDLFSQYASVALQEQAVEVAEGDQLIAAIPGEAGSLWRRGEARTAFRQLCSYEVLEVAEGESFVIEQGEGYTLNQSAEGILLFLGRHMEEKQLVEVHTARSKWGRTANIFEVRWSKPVQMESGETLYLLGGRRVFGPCDYLSF